MIDDIWPYCEGSRREEPERGRGAEEIDSGSSTQRGVGAEETDGG